MRDHTRRIADHTADALWRLAPLAGVRVTAVATDTRSRSTGDTGSAAMLAATRAIHDMEWPDLRRGLRPADCAAVAVEAHVVHPTPGRLLAESPLDVAREDLELHAARVVEGARLLREWHSRPRYGVGRTDVDPAAMAEAARRAAQAARRMLAATAPADGLVVVELVDGHVVRVAVPDDGPEGTCHVDGAGRLVPVRAPDGDRDARAARLAAALVPPAREAAREAREAEARREAEAAARRAAAWRAAEAARAAARVQAGADADLDDLLAAGARPAPGGPLRAIRPVDAVRAMPIFRRRLDEADLRSLVTLDPETVDDVELPPGWAWDEHGARLVVPDPWRVRYDDGEYETWCRLAPPDEDDCWPYGDWRDDDDRTTALSAAAEILDQWTGEEDSVGVTWPAYVPPCDYRGPDGEEVECDWGDGPGSGTWGGDDVIIEQTCRRCGARLATVTWADDGEGGQIESVTRLDPTAETEAWAAGRRLLAAAELDGRALAIELDAIEALAPSWLSPEALREGGDCGQLAAACRRHMASPEWAGHIDVERVLRALPRLPYGRRQELAGVLPGAWLAAAGRKGKERK